MKETRLLQGFLAHRRESHRFRCGDDDGTRSDAAERATEVAARFSTAQNFCAKFACDGPAVAIFRRHSAESAASDSRDRTAEDGEQRTESEARSADSPLSDRLSSVIRV